MHIETQGIYFSENNFIMDSVKYFQFVFLLINFVSNIYIQEEMILPQDILSMQHKFYHKWKLKKKIIRGMVKHQIRSITRLQFRQQKLKDE